MPAPLWRCRPRARPGHGDRQPAPAPSHARPFQAPPPKPRAPHSRFARERDAAQAFDCAALAIHGAAQPAGLRLNFSIEDAQRHLSRYQAQPAFSRIAGPQPPPADDDVSASGAAGEPGGGRGGRKRAASPGPSVGRVLRSHAAARACGAGGGAASEEGSAGAAHSDAEEPAGPAAAPDLAAGTAAVAQDALVSCRGV